MSLRIKRISSTCVALCTLTLFAACNGGSGGGEADNQQFAQVDRMGQPAVNTALISSGNKDAFNGGDPSTDGELYTEDMLANVRGLRAAVAAVPGFPPEDSPGVSPETVVSVVNPDTLRLDLSQATVFPNGRGFTDEVIDPLLGLVLNRGSVFDGGPGVSDGISNDSPGIATFPFAAAPQ